MICASVIAQTGLSDKDLYKYEKLAVDSVLGEFAVSSKGDTLRGSDFYVKYFVISTPHYFYKSKRMYKDSLASAQSKEGYWKHYTALPKGINNPSPSLMKVLGRTLELHRIKFGKISIYYYDEDNTKQEIVLNNPDVAFEIRRSGGITTRYFIEKGNEIAEIISGGDLKRFFEDNEKSLKLFADYFPKKNKGANLNKLIEVVELYNQ